MSSAMQPRDSFTVTPGIGQPAEPVDGLAARIVLAADEAAIAEPVEFGEQEGIVQLFAVRLVARNAGDLTWPIGSIRAARTSP